LKLEALCYNASLLKKASFKYVPKKGHLRSAQVDNLQWQIPDLNVAFVGILA